MGSLVDALDSVLAQVGKRVDDVYIQSRRTRARLREKGGKEVEMPCHHNLKARLHEHIKGAQLGDAKTPLLRGVAGRSGRLSDYPMR